MPSRKEEPMSTVLTLILTAVLTLAMVAYVAVYLTRVIRDDGAHGPRRTPPTSHHPDAFDPRSRFA
jgi:hypothetical protein